MDDVWVVFKCRVGGSENFWAWCRPLRDSPGFEHIYYTKRDGLTTFSPSPIEGNELPVLQEHLFTVVFPNDGGAPVGARFPEPAAAEPVTESGSGEEAVEAGSDAGGS